MNFISDSLGVNERGFLTVGGADVCALAEKYGTPLYIMDEGKIREICREFTTAMEIEYGGNGMVCYANKAFCCKRMFEILDGESMGTDVVSGGELYTAKKSGFPMERVYFHGNNKTRAELEMAVQAGVRRVVVDNMEELIALSEIAAERGIICEISFRIKPGIDAHTHEFVRTGKIDSKFGVALETGEAFGIIEKALTMPFLRVSGVHCHIGSQIFEAEPFVHASRVMMEFMALVKEKLGLLLTELNLGGGFGIRYIETHEPKSISDVVGMITGAVKENAARLGLPLPFLVLEPGRSIVGESGLTVYRVGSVKKIPNIRNYVSVDGGMTDNPRYALYGAVYEALLPERPLADKTELFTVAGRCCESGDLVARDVMLPDVRAGELLAVLATGAYNYSMAMNYNRVPRAPVVMVRNGDARLAVRRETYEDLTRCDE